MEFPDLLSDWHLYKLLPLSIPQMSPESSP
jgi:hypothetical protein